jgi:hypothetical protein
MHTNYPNFSESRRCSQAHFLLVQRILKSRDYSESCKHTYKGFQNAAGVDTFFAGFFIKFTAVSEKPDLENSFLLH